MEIRVAHEQKQAVLTPVSASPLQSGLDTGKVTFVEPFRVGKANRVQGGRPVWLGGPPG
jgi:hypothetical protein